MNELQIFKYENSEARTTTHNGEIAFVAKDVLERLGYELQRGAGSYIAHVPEEWRGVHPMSTPSGVQEMAILTEQGLYFFLARSDKPGALPFQKWIASEVIPSIRKHGAYMMPAKLEEMLLNPDAMITVLTALKEERTKNQTLALENEKQQQVIGELTPAKAYLDSILSSTSTLAITQIAADYNMTAYKLNKILKKEGIQRFVAGQWVLCAEHMNKGFVKSQTIHFTHADGTPDTKLHTKWTQLGRLEINKILNRRGIYAFADVIRPPVVETSMLESAWPGLTQQNKVF